MLSRFAAQLIVIGVTLVIGLLGWRWWVSSHDTAVAAEATIAQGQRTGEAAETIAASATSVQTQAQQTDAAVSTQRAGFQRQREVLRNENDGVASFDAVVVPIELRDLARERRCARERLGSTEPRGPCADGTPPTAR